MPVSVAASVAHRVHSNPGAGRSTSVSIRPLCQMVGRRRHPGRSVAGRLRTVAGRWHRALRGKSADRSGDGTYGPDPDRNRIMLTHALGCLGAALSMSLSWPQVVKSCVQRRTTGLSGTASALGVAMPIGWITYGLLSGEHLQIVTNVVTGTAGLAIMVALLATRPAMRSGRALRSSAAAAALVFAPVLLSGLAAALPGV